MNSSFLKRTSRTVESLIDSQSKTRKHLNEVVRSAKDHEEVLDDLLSSLQVAMVEEAAAANTRPRSQKNTSK